MGVFVFKVGGYNVEKDDYRQAIIKLIEEIESISLLEYIYKFIKKAVTVWK